jgi:hypothetical protein
MVSTWLVLAATTASIAVANEPAPDPPAACRTLAFLDLPCELALPPVPVVTLPLAPGGTELVPPQLTDMVDEVLSTTEQLPAEVALTELLPADDVLPVTKPQPSSTPLPVTGLLQPVTALVVPPAANAGSGAFGEASEPRPGSRRRRPRVLTRTP